MKATALLATLVLGLLVAPLAAEAQQRGNIPRVAVLSPASPPPVPDPGLDAFRQGLRAVGYVEGQTILLEYRYADWQPERLPALAAELVRLAPDVLFTYGMSGALAAKQTTTTIPIVAGAVNEPVANGLVASLARPGGNMTGTTTFGTETEGKRLALLKEVVPQITRVAVLVNSAHPTHARRLADLAAEAQTLGVQLHRVEARAPNEFEGAFATMVEGHADALLVLDDAMFHAHRHRIVEFASTHRLPAMSRIPGFAEAGGLMQYGESPIAMTRHAATHVDKILKGAKPGELPMEQPTKFEFVINLKTAKAFGLTIPPTLLFQADEVLQ